MTIVGSDLEVCTTVAQCYSGNVTNFVDSLTDQLGLVGVSSGWAEHELVALRDGVGQLSAPLVELDGALSQMTAALASLQSVVAPATNPEAQQRIEGNLSLATGSLMAVNASLGASQSALASLPGLLQSVQDLLTTFVEQLRLVRAITDCTWVADAWTGVIIPARRVFNTDAGALALLCALVAGSLLGWVATVILLQIRVGGVGREPGCPAGCCRAGCPAPRKHGKLTKSARAPPRDAVETPGARRRRGRCVTARRRICPSPCLRAWCDAWPPAPSPTPPALAPSAAVTSCVCCVLTSSGEDGARGR